EGKTSEYRYSLNKALEESNLSKDAGALHLDETIVSQTETVPASIILTIPELNEERRKDYVKQIKSFAEEARVALRLCREEARNIVKKADLPEDETNNYYTKIQDLINKYNKIVETNTKEKEQELMSI
ncbi:MAG: ribosome-recycling factor, partial [Bacilli bacterium]|nr:ribosome-recycling factor [Bacilli bacterium]